MYNLNFLKEEIRGIYGGLQKLADKPLPQKQV